MRDLWEIVHNNNLSEPPVFRVVEKKPMTPQEALLLPAGRELDAWIAKHITDATFNYQGVVDACFYSTDPRWAFLVEQKLFERGWLLTIYRVGDGGYEVVFMRKEGVTKANLPEFGIAPTVPLAICRAAIQVLIWEQENAKESD